MSALTEISFNMLPAIAYLSMAIFFMSQLSWKLTIVTVLFAPVPAIIASFAAPTQTRREQTLLDKWVRIYSRFNEVLSGIITVRSFAMEDAEKKRFLQDVNEANRTIVNANKIAVIKNGKVVELGNHIKLIHQNGYYASLVERQTKGLIVN
jgi:ATP-binding cassette subfamily B protein